MNHKELKDTALLIGTNPEHECVYSSSMPVGDYWDTEHVWDNGETVIELRLARLQGFLFGQSGELLQQFESNFSLETGVFISGWARHEDGTITSQQLV